MQPFQQRVVDESWELVEKILKLSNFIDTETFLTLPEDEQLRLKKQLEIMKQYSNILRERIYHFTFNK